METLENIHHFKARLDALERAIAAQPQPDVPIAHRFVPGLYIREMSLKAGMILTSMKHLTEHAFVLSDGIVMVTSETEGSVTYEAPFTGVTKAGTRRAMYAVTDVVWSTFHVTEETDVEKILEKIVAPNTNLPADYDIGWRRSLPNQLPSRPCPLLQPSLS